MRLRHKRSSDFVITPVDHPDIHVGPDSNFDVDDADLARSLLEQDDNYGPADDESRELWGDIAAEREAHDAVAQADDVGEITAADLRASLDTMSADELVEVRAQEQAGKARVSVLKKIDELLAPAGDDGQE